MAEKSSQVLVRIAPEAKARIQEAAETLGVKASQLERHAMVTFSRLGPEFWELLNFYMDASCLPAHVIIENIFFDFHSRVSAAAPVVPNDSPTFEMAMQGILRGPALLKKMMEHYNETVTPMEPEA